MTSRSTTTSLISPCEITTYKCRYAKLRDCRRCGNEHTVIRIRDDKLVFASQCTVCGAIIRQRKRIPWQVARAFHDQIDYYSAFGFIAAIEHAMMYRVLNYNQACLLMLGLRDWADPDAYYTKKEKGQQDV